MSASVLGWLFFAGCMGLLLGVVFMAWLQAWRDIEHDDQGCRCWRYGYLERGRDERELRAQIDGPARAAASPEIPGRWT